jgi:hypothetical protein
MGSLRRKTHTDETVLSYPEPFQADMCSALTNSLGAVHDNGSPSRAGRLADGSWSFRLSEVFSRLPPAVSLPMPVLTGRWSDRTFSATNSPFRCAYAVLELRERKPGG